VILSVSRIHKWLLVPMTQLSSSGILDMVSYISLEDSLLPVHTTDFYKFSIMVFLACR
jgi:hypothetical protein